MDCESGYLRGYDNCYDWGVFQVLKSYYLKIISTILHPSEWASVLASYAQYWRLVPSTAYDVLWMLSPRFRIAEVERHIREYKKNRWGRWCKEKQKET